MTNVEIIEQLENAIELIKQDGKDWLDDRDIPILEACIKSLMTLDKIKAEIEQIEINGHIRDVECFTAGLNTASKIIDKYMTKRGSEE